jgi:hypothetical protein
MTGRPSGSWIVPRAGFEPAWPCGLDILSVVRLPIPPPGPFCDFPMAARFPESESLRDLTVDR